MAYHVISKTGSKTSEIIVETYYQLLSQVEKLNYHLLKSNFQGETICIQQVENMSVQREQLISVGYAEGVEILLADFEQRTLSRWELVTQGIKREVKKLFNLFRKQPLEKGQSQMTQSNPIDHSLPQESQPQNDSSLKPVNPEDARARIAAKLKGAQNQSSVQSGEEVDYSKAFDEEVLGKDTTTVLSISDTKQTASAHHEDLVEAESTAAFGVAREPVVAPSSQAESARSTSLVTPVIDGMAINKETLLRNLAKFSEEQEQIRQKIQENNRIIEAAKRAELENEALEAEYANQAMMSQKLQQFQALFDELRDYLN